jgi:predicted nucleic acid-binding protein
MEAVTVDTSAIYALLDRSDANHNQAVAILKKLRNSDDTIVITNLILAETHALLLSKLGYAIARAWVRERYGLWSGSFQRTKSEPWTSFAPMRTRPSPMPMPRRLQLPSA